MWRKIISNANFKYSSKIIQTNHLIKNVINRFNKQAIKLNNNSKSEEFPNEFKIKENLNFLNLYKNKNRDDRDYNRNKDFNADNILKALPVFLLLSYLEFKKLHCYKATNKELDRVRKLIEEEIKNLEFKYKGLLRREPINYGIRGNRLYLEFTINLSNIDTKSIIDAITQTFDSQKVKFNFKALDTTTLQEDDLFSFKLDYEIMSSLTPGAKNRGTIYLRGTRGKVYDNFVFALEKQVDFVDLEISSFTAAYEAAFKPRKSADGGQSLPKDEKKNFIRRFKEGFEGLSDEASADDSHDPKAILHKYGVSVFMPDEKSEKKKNLDWDYLAGYENVKRMIEDSILLALTHGEVYDQITAGTRMKNETNRPKAILFEGPPGCGKTTSAKIIAKQVNIPLIYMPIEAIMSKYYGESETRFAEIFDAAKSLGRSIIFIDEIDSLATSREGGVHEATRRILSTLLRKIDGFESDGDVLLICATNRSKDLDPALLSRLDIKINFDLPDERMRSLIFQRYAKQLSQKELEELGNLSQDLSGRDVADICKDAERRWASKYIRKEKKDLLPDLDMYKECMTQRLKHMKGVNRQFEKSENPSWIKT